MQNEARVPLLRATYIAWCCHRHSLNKRGIFTDGPKNKILPLFYERFSFSILFYFRSTSYYNTRNILCMLDTYVYTEVRSIYMLIIIIIIYNLYYYYYYLKHYLIWDILIIRWWWWWWWCSRIYAKENDFGPPHTIQTGMCWLWTW
jgi:hypothetical protein